MVRPRLTDQQRAEQRAQLEQRVLGAAKALWLDVLEDGSNEAPILEHAAELLSFTPKGLQSALLRAELRWDTLRDRARSLAESEAELLKVAPPWARAHAQGMSQQLPPWLIDGEAVEPRERAADLEHRRREREKQRQDRVRTYVAAWLAFVRHIAAPDRLSAFVHHRADVAQAWAGGRKMPRREREAYVAAADVLANRHGPLLVAAAERLSEKDWLLCAEWLRIGTFESELPDVIRRLCEPLAKEVAALLDEYGYGPGATVSATALQDPTVKAAMQGGAARVHCCLDTARWPGGAWAQVSCVAAIGGASYTTKQWALVPGPASAGYLPLAVASRALGAGDFESAGPTRRAA